MPIVDVIIAAIIVVSIAIGFIRGFVKEAISIASLLIAIWAALYFGPSVGEFSSGWLSSDDLQMWFGRVLVFVVLGIIPGNIQWDLHTYRGIYILLFEYGKLL